MKNDLLYKLISLVHKAGVIGYDKEILTLLLFIGLRCVKNVNATSGNLLVSGETGYGKDKLVSTVLGSFLNKDKDFFHVTRVSEKALNYWQEDNWNNKIIYLEDIDESVLNSSIIRVYSSGGSSIVVVSGRDAVKIPIVGKPLLIVTGRKVNVDFETSRRWCNIVLDSNAKQVKNVLDSLCSDNKIIWSKKEIELFSYIHGLTSIDVVVPFSNKLVDLFAFRSDDMTLFKRFIDYIKSSAVLHGRKKASWYDYYVACFVFSGFYRVSLNHTERLLVDILSSSSFDLRSIEIVERSDGKITSSWLYRNKDRLLESGVVNIKEKFYDKANRDVEYFSSSYNGSVFISGIKRFKGSEKAFNDFQRLFSGINKNRLELGLKALEEVKNV